MRILYRVEAQDDVAAARAWYEGQQAGLGRTLLEALRRAEDLLGERPAAFPLVYGDFRRMVLHRFPYAIYYRPLDGSRLEIVAVLHQRQDTDVLSERGDV